MAIFPFVLSDIIGLASNSANVGAESKGQKLGALCLPISYDGVRLAMGALTGPCGFRVKQPYQKRPSKIEREREKERRGGQNE